MKNSYSYRGIQGEIELVEGTIKPGDVFSSDEIHNAELLSMGEFGLLLYADSVIVQIGYDAIEFAKFGHYDSAGFSNERAKGADIQTELLRPANELMYLSRFPQGVSPELMQLLLDAQNQTELIVLE